MCYVSVCAQDTSDMTVRIKHARFTLPCPCRLDKVSLTLWDTSSNEDVNINETAAKVLKTEDLTPKLPEVWLNIFIRLDGCSVAVPSSCQRSEFS